MIRIKGLSKKNGNYSVTYAQSARALNIESSSMSDDCVPYRESTGCMIWIDEDNMIGEIECIFPIIAECVGENLEGDVKLLEATPILEVRFEEKDIEMFLNESQLVLIFNKNRKVDKKYISSTCVFYASGEELIAISCTDFKLI